MDEGEMKMGPWRRDETNRAKAAVFSKKKEKYVTRMQPR
jgi:hypothetical protein